MIISKLKLFLAYTLGLLLCHGAFAINLSSTSIKPRSYIPLENAFGGNCGGQNIVPDFSWSNYPPETQSFALLMHDPDAPTGGSGWWHWALFNIPSNITSINAQTDFTAFSVGKNDYGQYEYGGPCPPVGEKHRYYFTIYALDVPKIVLDKNASTALIGFMINKHSIDKHTIKTYYKR